MFLHLPCMLQEYLFLHKSKSFFFPLQKNNRLYQVSVGQCLRVMDLMDQKGYVGMAICDGSSSQQWRLEG
jgi:hypothetical protein